MLDGYKRLKTGISKEQIKKINTLQRSRSRQQRGQMLVEGPQSVREALRFYPDLVRDVFLSAISLEQHRDLENLITQTHAWVHMDSASMVDSLNSRAQGIFALVDYPSFPSLTEMIENAHFLVSTVGMQDPGNLGTFIRTADAAGVDGVILGSGTVQWDSPKVIRAAAGSHFHLPIYANLDFSEIVSACRTAGIQVLLADARGSKDLYQLLVRAEQPDLSRPTLWVFGNEARGFTDAERRMADAIVSIGIYGKAESLNVAVAAALCMYATATKQRAS